MPETETLTEGSVAAPPAPVPSATPAAAPAQTVDPHAHTDVHGNPIPERLPLMDKLANATVIILPFIALAAAIMLAWGEGVGWVDLIVMAAMYLITGLGITVGFHRLLTHKSFETHSWIRAAFAIMGSMAVEGPAIRWVAFHRRHHQFSDSHEDPHSPHHHGGGFMGVLKGFYEAHMGWMLHTTDRGLGKYVPDLNRDKVVRTISNLWWLWALIGLAVPATIVGVITMSWMGALTGFLWGGIIRVALVHHVTWSVNSVCHMWGTKRFKSNDESRNNAIVGILGMGEGWHNNHHAFPTSARHGLAWWQIDTSWLLIKAMEKIGLVWNVRVPSAERLEAKRVR